MMWQDPNDKNPDDTRNLIIFMVLSLLMWLTYDHFVLRPNLERTRAAQEAALQTAQQESPGLDSASAEVSKRPRQEVIADVPRVKIENGALAGSLSLKGGRIDDLLLKRYFKTIEDKEDVVLFSPSGSEYPKYVEFGWVAADKSVRLPDSDTLWRVNGNKDLNPGHPVTLAWDNGQGLRFERTYEIDDNYMFTVTQRVTNASGASAVMYPYALVAEHGLPEDFDAAGRIAHMGPIGYIGGELHEHGYLKMPKKPLQELKSATGWAGLSEKYWFTGLIPEQQQIKTFRFLYTPPAGEGGQQKFQADIVGAGTQVDPGATIETKTRLFAGAKELGLLNQYGRDLAVQHFDLAIDFGLYYFMTVPFYYILETLGRWSGNFGIGIILLTVMVRLCVFPLANKSYRSFAKLKQVAPQMKELRDKYGSDKEKLQAELVKLYEKEKVNPLSGCFPILVQIPIFFALYKVLSISIEMRHAPFFGWIHDLSAKDPTSIFTLFGLIPWNPPTVLMIGAWPCLMLVTMLIQRKMNPPPQDPTQAMMVNYMPFFMTYIMAKFAAGLVIYWTFSSVLSILQQYVIMRSMGVPVHLFSRDKDEKKMAEIVAAGPSVHPGLEVVEETVEEALFGEGEKKEVSAPKRKKGKKKG